MDAPGFIICDEAEGKNSARLVNGICKDKGL